MPRAAAVLAVASAPAAAGADVGWTCSTEGSVWQSRHVDVAGAAERRGAAPRALCTPASGLNCNGDDLARSTSAKSAAECCAFCGTVAGCTTWTYDTHPSHGPYCYAKKDCNGHKPDEYCVSGSTGPMPGPTAPPAPPTLPPTPAPPVSVDVVVNTSATFQTMEGFGGCFNEKGWDALSALSATQVQQVMRDLFSLDDGCKFRINRMPIGSSDFGMDYYSLDDTPGDLAMQHLNLTRDELRLIPYIKAAMEVQSGLQVWGSPWTGPEWMKDSAPMPNNVGCGSLSPDPKVRAAYALYLARAAKAYRAAGLNFIMLAVQNEPNQGDTWNNGTQSCRNSYPKMHWTGEQLRDFVRDHLGPTFASEGIDKDVMIFLSTFPVNDFNGYIEPALNDADALKYLSGVGLQYAGVGMIKQINAQVPRLKTWETETPCGNGNNNWGYGEQQWESIRNFVSNGATVYSQWNMVLDQTGKSGWGWRQSAMVTVDTGKKAVTYNPHFYAVKHFSYFVEPGAKVVGTSGGGGAQRFIAFQNPGGAVAIVAANTGAAAAPTTVHVGDVQFHATLPPHSFNTFTVPGP